ncbi:hypothetical protein OQA88_5227 [Cercophora sp. LCS_1]
MSTNRQSITSPFAIRGRVPNYAAIQLNHWKTELSQLKAPIKRLEARDPNDGDLAELRQARDIAELEVEAWRIETAKTDSKEAAEYFEDALKDVKEKINAVKTGTPVASDQDSSTTSTSGSR